jgi:hypothetical protein
MQAGMRDFSLARWQLHGRRRVMWPNLNLRERESGWVEGIEYRDVIGRRFDPAPMPTPCVYSSGPPCVCTRTPRQCRQCTPPSGRCTELGPWGASRRCRAPCGHVNVLRYRSPLRRRRSSSSRLGRILSRCGSAEPGPLRVRSNSLWTTSMVWHMGSASSISGMRKRGKGTRFRCARGAL